MKMFHLRRFFWIGVLIILNAHFSNADSHFSNLEAVLISEGFENVAVIENAEQLLVTYENRVYRYEVHALQEVIRIVESNPKNKRVVIVIQHQGIPVIAVLGETFVGSQMPADYQWRATYAIKPYWQSLKSAGLSNRSHRKFDIVVYPQIKAQFGNFSDPVESQINIAPAIQTTLWPGMSLMLQWIFPLQNELGYEGDQGRPGLLTLSQWIRLPQNIFISATAGYFTQHRYGFDIEGIKFWCDGRWMVSGNAGYTGYASYLDKTWYYSDFDCWTWFLSGAHRFAKLDFTIQTTYGQFLYGDKGWRFDFSRQFGEVSIGFFAIQTEGGSNAGFNFSIPIFPMKRLRPSWIRVSPEGYFPWEYKYHGLPAYGKRYTRKNKMDRIFDLLNTIHLNNELIRI